jgi:hypothetical protein
MNNMATSKLLGFAIMLSLQCCRIMVELMREFEMTYNDITSSELDNLRIALRIENFKSKKQKTLTELIERELGLAVNGKSKFISPKHKTPNIEEAIVIDAKDAVETRLFMANPIGTVVVVKSTSATEPYAYTIVTDSTHVDAENFVISHHSPLGAKLSSAKIEDMIGHASDFYQVLDILPMVASSTI